MKKQNSSTYGKYRRHVRHGHAAALLSILYDSLMPCQPLLYTFKTRSSQAGSVVADHHPCHVFLFVLPNKSSKEATATNGHTNRGRPGMHRQTQGKTSIKKHLCCRMRNNKGHHTRKRHKTLRRTCARRRAWSGRFFGCTVRKCVPRHCVRGPVGSYVVVLSVTYKHAFKTSSTYLPTTKNSRLCKWSQNVALGQVRGTTTIRNSRCFR